MTKLCQLLGSRPDVMYECMYTKHKTQKRKIWQDGFAALSASRTIVVYDDDDGKAGRAIDEINFAPIDWDRKEECFETSKFLVEIVNETPIGSTPSVQASNSTGASIGSRNAVEQATTNGAGPQLGSFAGRGGKARALGSKFRTPLSRGPSRLSKPDVSARAGYPYSREPHAFAPVSSRVMANPLFDFDRNPTHEWNYVPNVTHRSPDEVLALLDR